MFRKTLKRSVSILTLLAMMLTLFPFAAFADETTASDLDGHWAEEVMQEWIGYGIIAGYEDGTVRPDRSITRAEMTALLDRVMDYQTTAANHFTDLDDNWYTDVVLKANAAGMISGYPDGTVKPDATISRQEAVAMFARVLSLDTANAPEADFTDMDAVGDWAKDAVNAMAAKGYVNGDNGQFRPQSGITRAEVITIFNNIFDDLYAESGTYFGDVNGSAVISADDVTLENTAIGGDLIVAEGVGDGHVVLDNVTIDGKLIIRGGGENSVIIRGNSNIGTVTVERTDGAVRVAVEGGASVDTLFVNDGNDTVTVEGSIGTLNVATGAAEIVLNGDTDTLNVSSENAVVTISGTLGTVTVDEAASDATINIQSDASVSTLTTAATNTTVNVLGSVETVQVADTASDATIAVSENASVNSVTTAAQNTTVSGEGTVTSVEVGETASGATVTTPGTTVENNSNDDVTIGDGETIGAGETATTPGGTTEEPSEPSTPSEPSRPSHTHTYVDGVCTAGDAYDPTWAQVNSAETWNAAVAAGQNIILTANFTTTAQLTINNTNSPSDSITVNGNGHIITAAGEQPWPNVNGSKHLVLITDAAGGSTTADNVTLKNITLDSANLAYGLQSFCVTNTVLNNVTLTGSVGAGLTVNGSTVTATALHTSGNGWGGVNVDKGSNVTDTTTFTFDAASTFAEEAPVYSDDATKVTITAPAGWAKVSTPTDENANKCTWQQLFAGGNGTEASPYLISTAQEFASIQNGADANHIVYYALSGDLDLSSCNQYGVYLARNIEIDGNGHRIYSSQADTKAYGIFCYVQGTTTIKNLVYDLTNFDCYGNNAELDLTGLIYQAEGADAAISFENVRIEGSHSVNSNNAPFIMNEFLIGDSTIAFNDCEMAASLSGDGYNACFLGWQGTVTGATCDATISFTDCTVSGELVCPRASIVAANGSQAGTRSYSYSGSNTLTGTVRGTTNAKYFTAVSETNLTDKETAAAQAFQTINGGSLYIGQTDNTLAISVNDSDKTITVTPSSNTAVTKYVVSVGLYTKLYNSSNEPSGTWKYFAEQTVSANDLSNLSFYAYDFIDADYTGVSNITTDASGNKTATLNDTTYYVVEDYMYPDESGLQGFVGSPTEPGIGKATIIQVSAYVGDTLYSTATVK